jgi:hypothetical protein
MEFSIYSRVQLEGGTVVAVVVALPMQSEVLAEVRTHNCRSRDEAIALLDPMSRGLRHDVLARGDVIWDE